MNIRIPLPVRATLSTPLRWIPLRIRSGPNAGRRWSLAAAGRGHWSGCYHRERFQMMSSLIRPHDCVWDVGAHQGYSVLVAVGAVDPDSPIVAFEPSPYNREFLEQHVAWNRCSNVMVMPVALADRDGTERFGGTGNSVSLHLGGDTELVAVRSADSLIQDGLPKPTFVKADIEGAEADMLGAATNALATVEVIMISVHSESLYRRCVSILQRAGFEVFQDVRIRQRLAESPVRWPGDPDVIAVRPEFVGRRSSIARIPHLERAPVPEPSG